MKKDIEFIYGGQSIKSIFLATLILLIHLSTAIAAEIFNIQKDFNDEKFIINGELFEAKTWCLEWGEGERIIFLDGSPFGACTSAVIYNVDKREICEVWCE